MNDDFFLTGAGPSPVSMKGESLELPGIHEHDEKTAGPSELAVRHVSCRDCNQQGDCKLHKQGASGCGAFCTF